MNERTHWQRVQELFHEVLELAPERRAELLQARSSDEPAIVADVESLLESHQAAERLGSEEPASPWAEVPSGTSALVGRKIGPYELEELLAEGGSGAVFRAVTTDADYRREVAVKVLREMALSARAQWRFQQERQILASFKHPHIAVLYEGNITSEGLQYLAMEFVDGKSIVEHCEEKGLSIRERLELFLKVCGAVQYAHQNEVVHRDLKPGNILVTERGEPKLLDFGIAKLLGDQDDERASATRTGVRLWTPDYATPEQVRGQPITTATDVYTLGLVLYELLTGTNPQRLAGASTEETEQAICSRRPPPPSEAVKAAEPTGDGSSLRSPSELRGDLDGVLSKALRKDPGRRYSSVEAFAADIQRHLDGYPVSARPQRRLYRAAKFIQRHKLAVSVLTGFFALLVAGAVLFSLQARQTARERDTAERISGFLVDLFEVSDPEKSLGERVTARQILDQAARRLAFDLETEPEVRARLLETVGVVYQKLGLYDEAMPPLEQSLDLRRQLHDEPHGEIARTLSRIALVHAYRGEADEAEGKQEQALAMLRAEDPKPSMTIARALSDLAFVKSSRGQFQEAIELDREALAMAELLLDPADPQLAGVVSNLATALLQLGDLEAAEPFSRRALAINEEAFGRDHPETARSLNNLGDLLRRTGEYAEAEQILQEAIRVRRKVLGGDHPDLAFSLNNLAVVGYAQGEISRAAGYLDEAARIFREALGEEHPHYATTLGNVAAFRAAAGEHAAAEASFREVLDLRLRLLDPDHPGIGQAYNNLSVIVRGQGRLNEAMSLAERGLAIRQARLDGQLDTATSLDNLGRIHRYRGDLRRAESYHVEALQIRDSNLPEPHRDRARSQIQLGIVYLASGRASLAESEFRKALAAMTELFGEEHKETAVARNWLGASLLEQGRTAEGRDLVESSFAIIEKSFPVTSESVRDARENLARL